MAENGSRMTTYKDGEPQHVHMGFGLGPCEVCGKAIEECGPIAR